jgi:phosphoribosylglycinamide formyltransferase-1
MIRIAVFASGNGTNAENIIKYFQNSSIAQVVLIISNNKDAKVLDRANTHNIKSLCFNRGEFYHSQMINDILFKQVDFIVLAGFLWKIHDSLIKLFPDKIINIHPALLPKYGGKGMYGMRVHRAVKDNRDSKTGITIHYVNENYDEGNIIFQKSVSISPKDTPLDIAKKVHKLEYLFYPEVIEKVIISDTVMFKNI